MKSMKKSGGFTLVELMIVVAIVGVLAVLSVFGVRKYIANAKTAEARNAVGQIAKDAQASFEREKISDNAGGGNILAAGTASAVLRSLCATSSMVPAAQSDITQKKYQSSAADWNHGSGTSSWKCLKYSMEQPQYYQYQYLAPDVTGTSGQFTINAIGDLDGNGSTSNFQMFGSVQAGILRTSPNIVETDPEE